MRKRDRRAQVRSWRVTIAPPPLAKGEEFQGETKRHIVALHQPDLDYMALIDQHLADARRYRTNRDPHPRRPRWRGRVLVG